MAFSNFKNYIHEIAQLNYWIPSSNPERPLEKVQFNGLDFKPEDFDSSLNNLIQKVKEIKEARKSDLNFTQDMHALVRVFKSKKFSIEKINELKSLLPAFNRNISRICAWLNANFTTEQIHDLKKLEIVGVGLKTIVPEIVEFISLEEFDFSENKVEELPRQIGQLSNLKFLSFANNNIKQFPVEIGQLTELQELFIPDNEFEEFPKEIFPIVNLESIEISGNYISEIPPEIGNLRQLTYLNLSENNLIDLPDEFQNLTRLENLDLRSNNFETIPDCLFKLPSTCHVYLGNNPLSANEIARAVAVQGPRFHFGIDDMEIS